MTAVKKARLGNPCRACSPAVTAIWIGPPIFRRSSWPTTILYRPTAVSSVTSAVRTAPSQRAITGLERTNDGRGRGPDADPPHVHLLAVGPAVLHRVRRHRDSQRLRPALDLEPSWLTGASVDRLRPDHPTSAPASPSIATTRSPDFSPALSAGNPGSTSPMIGGMNGRAPMSQTSRSSPKRSRARVFGRRHADLALATIALAR